VRAEWLQYVPGGPFVGASGARAWYTRDSAGREVFGAEDFCGAVDADGEVGHAAERGEVYALVLPVAAEAQFLEAGKGGADECEVVLFAPSRQVEAVDLWGGWELFEHGEAGV
jgi:hypothetical protein